MTAFTHFTNPYQDPANIPDKYRHHLRLQGLFQPDGRYTRPAEDPVTLWAIDLLHSNYGVPLEALQLELAADFSRRYMGRADVVVYDDRFINEVGNLDTAFIMVEAMEPNKKLDSAEAEGWQEHYERLNAYMSASPSARYAVLTSGTHTRIYRRDLEYPRTLQEIADLPH